MYGYGMHGWGMAFVWLIPLGLLLIFAYIFNAKKAPSAREILRQRYTKGEIDTKEYREQLRELGYTHEEKGDH